MSDSTQEEAHTGPIKTPKQLLLAVFLSFVIPVFVIIALVVLRRERKQAVWQHPGRKPGAWRYDRPGSGSSRGRAHPQGRHGGNPRCQPGAQERRGSLQGPVHDLPHPRRGRRAQVRRCGRLGTAHRHRLRRAGAVRVEGQGRHAAARRRRFRRDRNRSRRRLHGQRRRRQVRRAEGARRRGRHRRCSGLRSGADCAAPAAAAPAATTAAAPRLRQSHPRRRHRTAAAPAPAPAAPQTASAGSGEALYKQTCFVCHATGVAGAPKFGDKAAWAPRLQQGVPALVQSAMKGKGAMPPKGGTNASEQELARCGRIHGQRRQVAVASRRPARRLCPERKRGGAAHIAEAPRQVAGRHFFRASTGPARSRRRPAPRPACAPARNPGPFPGTAGPAHPGHSAAAVPACPVWAVTLAPGPSRHTQGVTSSST